jgi:5-methylcytosine-specific restriction endonuclease McrA
MHRYSRMHLSPEVAMRNLDAIDLDEKSRIAEGIALIAVIDERRDYLGAGYSCMRNYCMGRLHMSEDKALRRIQVAHTALRCPELFEYLADGRLSVTTASALAPHLEPENAAALLEASAFRSRPEIVRMLAVRSCAPSAAPAGDLLAEATPSVQVANAPVHVISQPSRCDCVAVDIATTEHAPAHAKHRRRGRVTPSATGDYDVRFTITEAEHANLRKAQALLGQAVPSGDPALIYARAMKLLVAHLEKQRLGVKPGAAVPAPSSNRIPKALKRLVWERDGGRCTFVSADGHCCEETVRVEVDHITPLAQGGKSTPENLRLLCSAHNRYEAERVLGKEHVQGRRELTRRERAKAKLAARAAQERQAARAAAQAAQERQAARAAAQAAQERQAAQARQEAQQERERQQTRAAARKERRDIVYAALRSLGSGVADARRGAEIADAMPDDATPEECLKEALRVLARPLIQRGERMAGCTA